MISELMKRVMQECDLRQSDLATVLGGSLSRVKAMTSGRVQKLKPDEIRRLVQTLNLSAHWLATGQEPMFNPVGGKQLGEALMKVRAASQKTADLDLTQEEAQAVAAVMTGVDLQNTAAIRAGLDKACESRISSVELGLLQDFRQCEVDEQLHILKTAKLLSAK